MNGGQYNIKGRGILYADTCLYQVSRPCDSVTKQSGKTEL